MRKILVITFSMLFMTTLEFLYSTDGDDILAKVEQTLTAPKDMESKCVMVLANKDGSGSEKRVLRMYSSGREKRLIKFIEPAGIEGIGLLVESGDEMNLYLPGMNKIRRIESGSKSENFQGTDFSYDELAGYEYQKDYSAVIANEDGQSYMLDLRRKQGSDRSYDSIKMTVDKSNYVPSRMELYSQGTLIKILTILEVTKGSQYTVPVNIRMEDVIK